MTLREIIEQKSSRLESVPEKFLSRLKANEAGVYNQVIELLNRLEVKGGRFVASADNLRLASQISDLLKDVMLKSDYTQALVEFAKEFDVQAGLNNDFFLKTVEDFIAADLAKQIIVTSKKNAIETLINGLTKDFVEPLRNAIEEAVVTNSSFTETLTNIQRIVTGDAEVDSLVRRYSTQIAHDTFAVADSSYVFSNADNLGFEFYEYFGGSVRDSRPFCLERHEKYFHIKEWQDWGAGKRTPGLSLPDSKGTWQGRNKNTNADTIMSLRGGYNCIHTPLPRYYNQVPKKDLQRAYDLGYWKPKNERQKSLINIK